MIVYFFFSNYDFVLMFFSFCRSVLMNDNLINERKRIGQVNVELKFFKLNTISFLHFSLDVFKYYSTIMLFIIKKDQS